MCQFVESIKFLNGKHYNLEYHQERLDYTRSVHFPQDNRLILSEILKEPEGLIPNKLYKLRFIYNQETCDIIYQPYSLRNIIQYFLLVCPNDFDYTFKTTNRSVFDAARKHLKADEDFIYIKNGFITDTSFANLVFSDGKKLFTPSTPLLKGTKRAYYLKQGIIQEEEIKVSHISKFKSFTTINAMVDLGMASDYSCDYLLLSHNQVKL